MNCKYKFTILWLWSNNYLKELNSILDKFNPVSLTEAGEVKLMNRIDRKYWFHVSSLYSLLERMMQYYDILEIDGVRFLEYQSTYFDTKDNGMYLKHHNQKLNRVKIRRRVYTTTGHQFLEVKLKSNTKRTIKTRIETDYLKNNILSAEQDFIAKKTPYKGEELVKTLNNKFNRITLINKNKQGRCTIDVHPKFWNEKGEISFKKLVVFELKRERRFKGSPMVKIMRELKIRQKGLSKYCTGRALLDPTLKRNLFKPRLRYIEKNILN